MASINWFPGHMFKAQKEIVAILPKVSVIIELLDARIPFSSENPVVTQFRGDIPCIKVLNKSDLADPIRTENWLSHFNNLESTTAIPINSKSRGDLATLQKMIENTVNPKSRNIPTALVLGIPNVGKSTLINSWTGKATCKTGNTPGITKGQQFIPISSSFRLLDTPGILWPKLEPIQCAYRLAITGAIKETAFEFQTIADFCVKQLQQDYFETFQQIYDLPSDARDAPTELIFQYIAKRRGLVERGGLLNVERAHEVLIRDLRKGSLGPITLETPDMIDMEDGVRGKIEGIKGRIGRMERKRAKKLGDQVTIAYDDKDTTKR